MLCTIDHLHTILMHQKEGSGWRSNWVGGDKDAAPGEIAVGFEAGLENQLAGGGINPREQLSVLGKSFRLS